MAKDPITTTGAAGTTDGEQAMTEKKDKVSIKDRVSNALTKKREFTVGGILKTVGFIVAIPAAILVGRGLQKAEDQALLESGLGGDTYTPEPQPLSLPAPEQEVQQEIIEPEYTEVE